MPYVEHADWARIYGDMGTGIWLGRARDAALPTTLTADPGADFDPAGWLGDSGIELEINKDVNEFNALQGGALIKRKVGKVSQKITFVCLETSAVVSRIVYAGQQPVVTEGVARTNIGRDQARTLELPMVVDVVEGEAIERYCFERVDLTFDGKITLSKNDDLRQYEMVATVLAGTDAYMLTNAPGMVPAA